ncbi:protein DENND6A isoform X1 [Amborella trichopoda]|uniref:UDENN domain-containing protein n=1 Tax=Amborella trichopoda TaxID=13333 RepID=W1NKT9_AMBTC|nr:protein DENND6A isoform X1 [Amborella trichopoda]ERM95815.1 hypothetical protein AMTR_s00060p00051530 [Amborella trichopoda]|eukprot:XP_006828399.1 protein DENND6A isoform X1 [Amborella trichopoda]
MSRASSLSPKLDPNSRPDLNALKQWVVGFCIIRFDLEQGQVIEECYPPGLFSQDEELDIAFSSFPDSMSQHQNRSSIHDCMFFFRFRRRGTPPINKLSENSEEIVVEEQSTSQISDVISLRNGVSRERAGSGNGSWANNLLPNAITNKISNGLKSIYSPENKKLGSSGLLSSKESLHILKRSSSHHGSRVKGGPKYLYGYVFNRQRQDERLKRGGEQKSVVILSYRPYSSVFKPLLQILGHLCFDIGKKALEHIAFYVSKWPTPQLGKLMELPIGSATLKVYLPPAHCLPADDGSLEQESFSGMAPFTPTNQYVPQGIFHETDIFGIFRGILLQLWVLWEILIIGEPLLIFSPTPSQCCEAVAGLISLVAPLFCSIDFRPYFTIHDPDFALLNSLKEGDRFPSMILGVTNLFFLKALRIIPHVVSVGSPIPNSSKLALVSNERSNTQEKSNPNQLSLNKFSPSNLLNAVKMRREGPLILMTEYKEAVWSSYNATTKPDTGVLNRLVDAGLSPRIEESMSVVNNEILRRHFLELTTNFLAPFGPYFRAITPSEGTSPFCDPPPLPAFDAREFLDGLSARGPGKFMSKRMRANWLDLYRRFLTGHNFMPWFRRRRSIAELEQHRLWRQVRMKADIQQFVSKMSELEIVDCFHFIERHILGEIQVQQAGKGDTDSARACQKLKSDLKTVFNTLPKDTQQLLIFNPQCAALLQGSLELTRLPGRPSVLLSETSLSSSPR